MHLGLYIPHNSFGMWGFIGIVGLEGATYLTHPKIISSAICTYKSMSQFSSQFSSKLTCHPIPSTCPSIHATRWGALYRTQGEPQGLHLVQRSLASTPQSEREKRQRRWRWWLPDSGSDRLALLHRFCLVCLTSPLFFSLYPFFSFAASVDCRKHLVEWAIVGVRRRFFFFGLFSFRCVCVDWSVVQWMAPSGHVTWGWCACNFSLETSLYSGVMKRMRMWISFCFVF
jgi:hypothetical protein